MWEVVECISVWSLSQRLVKHRRLAPVEEHQNWQRIDSRFLETVFLLTGNFSKIFIGYTDVDTKYVMVCEKDASSILLRTMRTKSLSLLVTSCETPASDRVGFCLWKSTRIAKQSPQATFLRTFVIGYTDIVMKYVMVCASTILLRTLRISLLRSKTMW